jgi:hypothetical protein
MQQEYDIMNTVMTEDDLNMCRRVYEAQGKSLTAVWDRTGEPLNLSDETKRKIAESVKLHVEKCIMNSPTNFDAQLIEQIKAYQPSQSHDDEVIHHTGTGA